MAINRVFPVDLESRNQRRRPPLAPVAYSESLMPALRLTRSSRIARRISTVLMTVLAVMTLLMTTAPWQQSLFGTGNVLAFAPDQRQQVIQSPIHGRVHRWGENIYENARVTEGQEIVEIRDLDPEFADRLENQRVNAELAFEAAQQQYDASVRALADARTIVESLQNNVTAFRKVLVQTTAAQNAFVEMARQNVLAEKQQLAEFQAGMPQLEADLARLRILEAEGNVSLFDLQLVERQTKEQQAKVDTAAAKVQSAESSLEGKINERDATIQRAEADIEVAESQLRRARQDVSRAESEVAAAQQSLRRAEIDLRERESQVARQGTRIITAPFDGYLVSIDANLQTGMLNAGDKLCTIVPDTTDRSVQLWLEGVDAPLVDAGRHVRLQFEGWPAVQFTGWPSVAVGTFGGQVVSVDAVDDGRGRFRVLIRPDPDDIPWPDERFLRQGVRSHGWVLLEQVPLWYEVWRRLNGFPPRLEMDPDTAPRSPDVPSV